MEKVFCNPTLSQAAQYLHDQLLKLKKLDTGFCPVCGEQDIHKKDCGFDLLAYALGGYSNRKAIIVVEIRGGVAEVTNLPDDNLEVRIIDHDNDRRRKK